MESTDQADPSCSVLQNFMNIDGTMFLFFVPWLSAGPQNPQTLTASQSKYENFGPKI